VKICRKKYWLEKTDRATKTLFFDTPSSQLREKSSHPVFTMCGEPCIVAISFIGGGTEVTGENHWPAASHWQTSQKSPHFSLLSPTSPCELSEWEVTSPSNLKVVRALYICITLWVVGKETLIFFIDFRKSPRFYLTSPSSQLREKSSHPVFTM
jgi:hypothetical protein